MAVSIQPRITDREIGAAGRTAIAAVIDFHHVGTISGRRFVALLSQRLGL